METVLHMQTCGLGSWTFYVDVNTKCRIMRWKAAPYGCCSSIYSKQTCMNPCTVNVMYEKIHDITCYGNIHFFKNFISSCRYPWSCIGASMSIQIGAAKSCIHANLSVCKCDIPNNISICPHNIHYNTNVEESNIRTNIISVGKNNNCSDDNVEENNNNSNNVVSKHRPRYIK